MLILQNICTMHRLCTYCSFPKRVKFKRIYTLFLVSSMKIRSMNSSILCVFLVNWCEKVKLVQKVWKWLKSKHETLKIYVESWACENNSNYPFLCKHAEKNAFLIIQHWIPTRWFILNCKFLIFSDNKRSPKHR